MLLQLIYSSDASPDLELADFEKMLGDFRVRNRARGITGVLLFINGVFVQVLEGDNDRVLSLLRSLERDPRHHDLKVFYRSFVDERSFDSWSMAYLSPSAEEVSRWAELGGATTVEKVIAALENDPKRVESFVVNLLRAIAD